MENEKNNWDTEIMEKCPILYCMYNKSMIETCMCYGFECREGWSEPLWKLSAALETLNMTYWPKYHIRIQADQVKEKIGTLRFYYSVIRDDAWYRYISYKFFDNISRKLNNINYKYERIQEIAPYTEHKKIELKTKEEFVKELYYAKNISNVKVWEEAGKYWKQTDLEHYGTYKYIPTRHKFLYKLMKILSRLAYTLRSSWNEPTARQSVIMNFMDNEARRLVKIAEDECYDTCEECGANIGKRGYAKRCETSGWIKYICDRCAEKKDRTYYMDGALYSGGKCLKTKEVLAAERSDAEAKYKDRMKKYEEEKKEFEKDLEEARLDDIKFGRTSAG